jgi:hypothetical protein
VKAHVAVSFDASVAEQLTGVVPIGKLDPDREVHETVNGAHFSAVAG